MDNNMNNNNNTINNNSNTDANAIDDKDLMKPVKYVKIIDGKPHYAYKNWAWGEEIITERLDYQIDEKESNSIKRAFDNRNHDNYIHQLYYKNLVNFKHYEDRAATDDFTYVLRYKGYTYTKRFQRYIYSEKQYMDCRNPLATGDVFDKSFQKQNNEKIYKYIDEHKDNPNADKDYLLEALFVEASAVCMCYNDLNIIYHMENTFGKNTIVFSLYNLDNTLYNNQEFNKLLETIYPNTKISAYGRIAEYFRSHNYFNLNSCAAMEQSLPTFKLAYFCNACDLYIYTNEKKYAKYNVSRMTLLRNISMMLVVCDIKNKDIYTNMESLTNEMSEFYNEIILEILRRIAQYPDSYFEEIQKSYSEDYKRLESHSKLYDTSGMSANYCIRIHESLDEVNAFISKYYSDFTDIFWGDDADSDTNCININSINDACDNEDDELSILNDFANQIMEIIPIPNINDQRIEKNKITDRFYDIINKHIPEEYRTKYNIDIDFIIQDIHTQVTKEIKQNPEKYKDFSNVCSSWYVEKCWGPRYTDELLSKWATKDSEIEYTPLNELPESVRYSQNHHYMNVIREGLESQKSTRNIQKKQKSSFFSKLFKK